MRGSIVWLSERDSPEAFPPVDRALRVQQPLQSESAHMS